MKAFWLKRPWHHLGHKNICEGRQDMINIRVNLRHLVWSPDLTSALATKHRQEVSLTADWTFLCPCPSIPKSTVPFIKAPLFTFIGFMSRMLPARSNSTVNPETIFALPQCLHMRSLLVENSISPCRPPDCSSYQWHNGDPFSFVWSNHKPVSSLTAGDLAHLPSVCPGEDSGLRRATGYVLVGDDTGQRHNEIEKGKKKWGRRH